MSKFKYGVSFNCNVDDTEEVGGGGEGDISLDYVGTDLEAIERFLIADGKQQNFNYVANHDPDLDVIGGTCDLGGKVVSAIGEYADDYFFVTSVIFENPSMPSMPSIID